MSLTKARWALPGGFVEIDEDLPEAAARELAEETGLKDVPLEQLRTFGKPGRDPRGRTITVVYFGIAGKDWQQIKAADDAAQVQWFDIEDLPPMAFDHDEIARCAIETAEADATLRRRVRRQVAAARRFLHLLVERLQLGSMALTAHSM